MDDQIRTFTEAEFCKQVKISRTTAWQLRKTGKLSFCRIGAKIIYTQEHIQQFLAAYERPAIIGKPSHKRAK